MAIKGTEDYDKAQSDEMNMLNEIDTKVRETVKNLKEPYADPTKWDETKVVVKTSSDNKKVPVPIGYTEPTLDAEKSVDGGYVIKDTNQNEWVWVPVDEATYNSMFVTETVALSGSTGVTTAKYSASGLKPGDPSYGTREPDIIPNYEDDDTSAQAAGFVNLNDMATKMVSEYNTMADSIKKYGGFYIGRYELSNNGIKAGYSPITSQNWHDLYKECKELTVDETKGMVRMIWRMPMGRNM